MTATTNLLCAALAVLIGAGLARADNIGGSINNNEKTLSGTVREPPQAETERPAGRHRPAAPTRRSSPQGASRGEGGLGRYDGAWTAILPAGCGGAGAPSFTISGGRLSGLGFSGTVSPKGEFRTVDANGGVSTGRFTGSAGSGTFRQADGCSRTIRLIKN
jgi:hypothetical protein